jgi:hypothetical protein
MQADSEDSKGGPRPSEFKPCPLCGREIRKSAYRCPHCHETLAEIDQRQWEHLTPPPPSGQPEESSRPSDLKEDFFAPLPAALLIAAVIIVVIAVSFRLFNLQSGKEGSEPPLPEAGRKVILQPDKSSKPPKLEYPSPGETVSFPAPQDTGATSPDVLAAVPPKVREERIREVSAQLLVELRKGQETTRHTVLLKTGAELQCTILSDNAETLTVKYKGVTTRIDKEKVETIRQRTQEEIERELQALALARATDIVDAESRNSTSEPLSDSTAPAFGQTPPSAGEIIDLQGLVPGVATRTVIKSTLGAPDMEFERVLDYNWKYGIELVMAEDPEVLAEVRINSDRFRGRLSSGISLASTMHEVFATYGRPAAEMSVQDVMVDEQQYKSGTLYRSQDFSRIWYREEGLTFWFTDDRVIQIAIGKPG